MRQIGVREERTIRAERVVREWTRSGLIEKVQLDRIMPTLQVDLRRTNLFLRLILFGFGILVMAASVFFVAASFRLRDEFEIAGVCLAGAALAVVAAELLRKALRLYRFGVEEAAAVGAVALLGSACFSAGLGFWSNPESPAFVALAVASAAALAVYLRYGYVYAVAASMVCSSLAPFQIRSSEVTQRLVAAGILLCFFLVARHMRRDLGDEFPGDDYSAVQAMAWLGVYAYLNLMLASLVPAPFPVQLSYPALFRVFTYVMVWVLPAAGLALAIRDKDRWLLDVNLALALATLATNKPYLGLPRQTWDPILLGLLLIGVALGLRRWLANGEHRGFTAARILDSDKRRISVVATVSTALETTPAPHADSAPADKFDPGGGRSGGAGASGSF